MPPRLVRQGRCGDLSRSVRPHDRPPDKAAGCTEEEILIRIRMLGRLKEGALMRPSISSATVPQRQVYGSSWHDFMERCMKTAAEDSARPTHWEVRRTRNSRGTDGGSAERCSVHYSQGGTSHFGLYFKKSARCGVKLSIRRPASSALTPWTTFEGAMKLSPAERISL